MVIIPQNVPPASSVPGGSWGRALRGGRISELPCAAFHLQETWFNPTLQKYHKRDGKVAVILIVTHGIPELGMDGDSDE